MKVQLCIATLFIVVCNSLPNRHDPQTSSALSDNQHWRPLFFDDPKASRSILDVYRAISKYYLPQVKYIENEKCKKVVNNFLINLRDPIHSWSLRMGDSWGKIPDGFLFGNVHAVGMFEECLKISGKVGEDEQATSFRGKYCTIIYKNLQNDSSVDVRSGPGMVQVLKPLPFYYGTCIPSVCSDEELFISLNATLQDVGRQVTKLECQEEEDANHKLKFDGFDAFVCALLLLLIALVVCGTVIDETSLLENYKSPNKKEIIVFEVLKCFSLTSSFKGIFAYRTDPGNTITCLHGMRAITIIWIMTCHQYETSASFLFNTFDSAKYQDPVISQAITNGYESVDTFFCLSGILLAYRFFPAFSSGQFTNAMTFLISFGFSLLRRFLRLCPSIFMVAVFSSTLLRFLGFGPRLPDLEGVVEDCRDTWWKDAFFLNNLIRPGTYCLSHCWYTSVEFQLFIIIPLVFLPLIYNTFAGFVWLSVSTTVSMIVPLIILVVNDFTPIIFPYLALQDNDEFYDKYYTVTWCRAAPWFIGIWTGLLLSRKPARLQKIRMIYIVIGYILAIGIGQAFTIGLYRYNHLGKHEEIELWVSALYAFFSRPLWAVAISFVVVTCHFKNSGYVNAILSYWGWQPLSRLAFGMYLIGPVVQRWWESALYLPTYYSYLGKLFEVSGTFFISFVFAFLLAALVERPFLLLTESFSSTKVTEKKKREK